MTSGGVAVGFCYAQGTQTPQWRRAYTMVLMREAGGKRRIVGEFAHEVSGVHIPDARCKIVADFLNHPQKPEWLWMIDTDATFGDDVLDRLLAAAHPTERPIVGGLAFGVRPLYETGNSVGASPLAAFPTLYILDGEQTRRVEPYERDALVQVHATGAHCLLIHRKVLADPRWQAGWFQVAHRDGRPVSEDQFFCVKAGSFGYPIYVHTGVRTGHVKTFVADEDYYLRTTPPSPATDPAAVIVPVLNRPQAAEPFMRTLRATTGLATVYAVAEESDVETWTAWVEHGASVLFAEGPSFAVKANHGYRETHEPWLLLVGDDVRFREGWYDRALRAAGDRFHLVATNDCGNPHVLAGRHATHPLIRRRWLDEHGASWDGPKTVAHEGYRHWFVDNEWTTVAQQAGVFTYASDSVIEHLHPAWGKATDDDTYRKGQAHADQDQRLFQRRLRAFT